MARRFGVVAAVVAAVVGGAGSAASAAPGEGTVYGDPNAVYSGYVVQLQDAPGAQDAAAAADFVASRADDLAQRFGGTVSAQYSSAISGFAITGIDETRARQLAAAPGVAVVERNALMKRSPQPPPITANGGTQSGPTWGLDRIDHHERSIDGAFDYPNTAPGVTAYLLDGGIRISHNDFAGRATYGRNFVDRVLNPIPDPANVNNSNDPANANDCDGYGTHSAGTVGGTTYGVAKQIALVAVRVLDCLSAGFVSEAVGGIDWVTAHAQHPAVAELDNWYRRTILIDAAVQRSIGSGITWIVPAGDWYQGGDNACYFSPTGGADTLVVGASSYYDSPAYYSNWGSCLDLWAPGDSIPGDGIASDVDTVTMSGSSMAAAYATGAAALILQAHQDYTPAQVRGALIQGSTVGALDMTAIPPYASQASQNRLLYVRQAEPARPVGKTRTLFNPKYGTTEVYARSDNADHLIYAYWSRDWSAWMDLGGPIVGDPAVLYNPNYGTTEVYARLSNNHLGYRYFSGGWSPWIDLGGSLAGNPAVIFNPKSGTTEVYVRTAANSLAYVYYAGGWSGWTDLGGTLSGDPGVLYNPKYGTTEAYTVTGTGLQYQYYLGGWSGWINLGGTVQGAPAVLYNPKYGTTEVYLRTATNELAYVYYLGGWSGWTGLGGTLDQDPGVIYNRGSGTTEVYVHTPADTLQYVYYLGGWSGWNNLGGTTAGSPSVLYNPRFGTTEAYTLAQDGHAYYKYYAGGWSNYIDITP
ncbi:S8 family serine peptidase [Dactylosporangium sp. NPDC051541]|uniref:S8 family serine peptidase n=1 Tax=Dactylosporangium sp. NPDC051541 TaxID=3363977 RepID=UPI0037A462D5